MENTSLQDLYASTREESLALTRPLRAEDYRIQSMPDVSPPWWNLGHTTWFFAKNVLEKRTDYRLPYPGLEYLLNSYYESLGPQLPRDERGQVTRPTTGEIMGLRAEVDERMRQLLAQHGEDPDLEFLVRTGIQHEQQHQELLVTEIKHILGTNPRGLREPYGAAKAQANGSRPGPPPLEWLGVEGGLNDFGNIEGGWCWDNELPVHRSYTPAFSITNRLVTVAEFAEFIEDGGYDQPLHWLANGWERVSSRGWVAPLYWEKVGDSWSHWTLAGDRALGPSEPVCHLSYYEADAYATWLSSNSDRFRGARIPTEHEWELAAREAGFDVAAGNFLEDRHLHPRALESMGTEGALLQSAGTLWEWTSSHYEPYPGFVPFDGTLMEYNAKFMDNQRVLRGGSCATPRSHIRPSYRNYWPADTRFQFTGLRLARTQ